MCVERQIFTAVKAHARKKHSPLNASVPLDFAEVNTGINPESVFLDRERKIFLETEIGRVLSLLEKNTLSMYLDGKSYAEISSVLNINMKAVGNALQRVRKKINSAL
jgi:RNA polymerase sporulation-specific sigma factor